MRLCSLALFVALLSTQAQAVIYSDDLAPGDTFHLVFATDGEIDATSPNTSTYNDFAQAQAAAAGLDNIFGQTITWKAIVSTVNDGDARDNVGNLLNPIYNTGGLLVAPDQVDFWGQNLNEPIALTQFMVASASDFAWTGTTNSGFASAFPLGSGTGTVGLIPTTSKAFDYLLDPFLSDQDDPIYAISSPITYQAESIPEPATAMLLPLAGAAVLMRRRRVRK